MACLVEGYIELKQPEEAEIALARMDERLQELKAFAGDKGGRKEVYLNHVSAYWDHMARLAELELRKIDAMGFYENALLARLDAKQKPVPGEKDELAESAEKLCSSLGGTSAAAGGFSLWFQDAQSSGTVDEAGFLHRGIEGSDPQCFGRGLKMCTRWKPRTRSSCVP